MFDPKQTAFVGVRLDERAVGWVNVVEFVEVQPFRSVIVNV